MANNHLPATLSLSGADWFIRADTDGEGLHSADIPAPGWIPASVPATSRPIWRRRIS